MEMAYTPLSRKFASTPFYNSPGPKLKELRQTNGSHHVEPKRWEILEHLNEHESLNVNSIPNYMRMRFCCFMNVMKFKWGILKELGEVGELVHTNLRGFLMSIVIGFRLRVFFGGAF